MSKRGIAVYELGDKLLIKNRSYHADEAVELANHGWRDGHQNGFQEAFEIQAPQIRLTTLLTEILLLAGYSEPYKFSTLILQLAKNEAGEPNIETLAGELLKRLDVLSTTFQRITFTPLADMDETILRKTLLIRAALLEARTDNGAALRSPEIQAIYGTVVKWTPPTQIGRPKGMLPENLWLVSQIKRWKQPKREMWEIGKAIFQEIKRKLDVERTPEETAALALLNAYIFEDNKKQLFIPEKSALGKRLSDLVSRAKKLDAAKTPF